MNKSLFVSIFISCAAIVRADLSSHTGAQTSASVSPPQALPLAYSDHVERLDAVIVTGTVDRKTTFDLAQGASALSGHALLLQQEGTLGEMLSRTPGVSSTYYGPGASRPIIRGLGGDRVRMLEDGVGSLDLSSISPDHNVSIEPLLLDHVEVLRGPATLLYGSSAVGGVVNVVDNRIPNEPPASIIGGRAETRFDTAAKERTGVVAVNGGNSHFGLQLDGLRTRTDDVKIPGVAQQGSEAPGDQRTGILPNTDVHTKCGSVGGTWFGANGFLGAAVGTYQTNYGVPTGEEPGTRIDMRQRRYDVRGAYNPTSAGLKTVNVRFSYGDYTHRELSGTETVNTTFKNKAWETRLEAIQEKVGDLSGTVGIQVSRNDFSAEGEEVVTPPTVSRSAAVFVLEEYKLERVTLQAGARYEWQRIALGEVADGLPAFDGYAAGSGAVHTDHGISVSGGAVMYPAQAYSLGLSVAASQRLPVAQELYSNGPHGGTAAYEVGRSDLGRENSFGVDLTLRRRGQLMTGSVGVFANQFDGYVYERQLPEDATPVENNPDGLTAYQFVARDALFYGGEAELELHLIDGAADRLHLLFDADYVRAEDTTDHQPLPRIPAKRVAAEVRYEHGGWSFGANVRYVFRQDRVAELETPTSGYLLLGADAGYAFTYGRIRYDLFLRGSNLADRAARVHTSFLKDFAPLPGRDLTAGLRLAF